MEVVGKYVEKFNQLTGQSLECRDVFQSEGLCVHIEKRHPDCVAEIPNIPLILASPDYIGRNPKEKNSVELVKRMGDNLMVCVKLDLKSNYFFVATLFKISDSKLKNRIASGRLKKYN